MRLELTCPCGGTFVGNDTADSDTLHVSLRLRAEAWEKMHAVCVRPLFTTKEAPVTCIGAVNGCHCPRCIQPPANWYEEPER